MAITYTNLNSLFMDIANNIRSKTGDSAEIVADNFPTVIESINTGFDYVNNDITDIPDYGFYNCKELKSVDCYNLISIGENAFSGCENLESVMIYENVTTIGQNAFKGCSNLTIYCAVSEKPEGWNENWNPDNCEVVWNSVIETWDISATENDHVTAELYNDISNKGKYSLIINGHGNMCDYGFGGAPWYSSYKSNITSVIIKDGVTSIGNTAFDACSSLTNVTISNSIMSIGQAVFRSCSSLTSVTLPNNITNIRYAAFSYCSSLTSITIPKGVTSIGDWAFRNCDSLTSITIPKGVTSIGEWAFYSCDKLTIYCEAEAQPNTWDVEWNSSNRPAVWGYTYDA